MRVRIHWSPAVTGPQGDSGVHQWCVMDRWRRGGCDPREQSLPTDGQLLHALLEFVSSTFHEFDVALVEGQMPLFDHPPDAGIVCRGGSLDECT